MTTTTTPPTTSAVRTTCRSCDSDALTPFFSLGTTPLADALLSDRDLDASEDRYDLDVAFCPNCSLVQIVQEVPPKTLFVDNYLYFSSFADDLLAHSRQHAQALTAARGLDHNSLVVEVASNDGYLLRWFAEAGVPVLGIDPAPGQAAAAEARGIPTLQAFFGDDLARRLRSEGTTADVIIANNVMAHVPDLNGFVAGLRTLIADDGVITIENPYVRDLVEHCEFDTIYHEHLCYFSCTAVDALVRRHGMFLNDVEYFPKLHGGTLRWHVSPQDAVTATAKTYLAEEAASGLTTLAPYVSLSDRADRVRAELLQLLRGLRADGARIAAYGAAAKGSTMVNFVGLDSSLIDFVVDRNTHKQGRYMPGVHLPIRPAEALLEEQPDYVVLLAWNFKDEILRQQQEYLARGGRFIIPIPVPTMV
jgi:SAM-dependent methyltransferase